MSGRDLEERHIKTITIHPYTNHSRDIDYYFFLSIVLYNITIYKKG